MRRALSILLLAGLALPAGCVTDFGPKAVNGITFYSPGAGNLELADEGLRRGLELAEYDGQVATVMWTFSFNPAIDQALRLNARLGARKLADKIEEYAAKYPGRPINMIGLSAGTGVTIWALERLDPAIQVDSVVLLASSLSHDYDVSRALRRVKGSIYNYYSSSDVVLAVPMKVFGTIDAKFGVDGAGAVGLTPPGAARDRVINIPWRREFARYGYRGGHMDSISARFIGNVVAEHLVTEATRSSSPPAVARPLAGPPPAAGRDRFPPLAALRRSGPDPTFE